MTRSKLARFCSFSLEISWYSAIILPALFFNVYSSRIFEPDKIALLRSLSLVILLLWIVKTLEGGFSFRGWRERVELLFQTPLIVPASLLILSYLLSTIFSVVPRTSFLGSYQRMQGTYTTLAYIVIFFSLVFNVESKEQIRRLVSVMIFVSLPITMYGLLQRYQIDPIPWGGDTSARIASTMGNSIFIAAYIIMVFPLTIGRIFQSMQELNSEQNFVLPKFIKATLYIFIVILQVVALYFSGSRGPALGWIAGMMIFGLTYVWWKGRRGLGLGIIGGTLLLMIFLIIFNLPNSPFEALKSNPSVGRFGQLLDPQSNNARVRTYIWQGAARLVGIHDPIEYPDGEKDRFNFLRPLIGYGPESMYVAYNRFYPPELTQVEKRNASPDRSHNETWDSLVNTGVIGFLIYIILFLAIFRNLFQYLGILDSKEDTRLFYSLEIGFGLLFTIFLVGWRGIEYFGIAFPLGMIAGIFLLLAYKIIAHANPVNIEDKHEEDYLLLISILCVMVAHLIEINFGIAIVVTRIYFWILCGLLVVQIAKSNQLKVSENAEAIPLIDKKHKKRIDRAINKKVYPGGFHYSSTLIYSAAISIVLVVLGYNFFTTTDLGGDALSIMWKSLTMLRGSPATQSFGILLIFSSSFIIGALVFVSEHVWATNLKEYIQAITTIMIISFIIAFGYWLVHTSSLSSVVASQANSVEDIIAKVGQYEGLLETFYISLFILIFIIGLWFILSNIRISPLPWYLKIRSVIALVIGGFILIPIIGKTNLQVIKADIAFKLAEPFAKQDTWPVSIEIYKHAIELAPNEDYYYLFLGRAYLEQGKLLQDINERDQIFSEAKEDLETAQHLNPLNTDHTANLARLYSLWYLTTTDSQLKSERFKLSDQYFEKAMSLSPNNSRIWGEWAVLLLSDESRYKDAFEKLLKAYELDPIYDWTSYLFGEYYAKVARQLSGEERADAVQKAIANYQKAVSLATDESAKVNYLLTITQFSIEENKLDSAINALEEVLVYAPNSAESWKYENLLSKLYNEIGNVEMAILHAQRALSISPTDQRQQLEEYLKTLEQLNQ